ncbi:MAG TPA: DUF3685 domain-containing protein [Thermosynechococcaceae cyanobacterium]
MQNSSATPLQLDRVLRLLIVESDPVFQAGLLAGLAQFPDLRVVLVESSATAPFFQERLKAVAAPDVALLSLDLAPPQRSSVLRLCRQLRSWHPALPVLLLGFQPEPLVLQAGLEAGATGFWSKGGELAGLVAALRQVAAGQAYWPELTPDLTLVAQPTQTPWGLLKQNLRRSGLRQIEGAIVTLNSQLTDPNLSGLDQVVLTGRRRELRTARWLVNRLLPDVSRPLLQPKPSASPPAIVPTAPQAAPQLGSAQALQAHLFDRLGDRLQSSLRNLTTTPLEIDILKPEKKQELLQIALRKAEQVLEDLRFSQVQPPQLVEQRSQILQDLWQAVLKDFFGKYSTLKLGDQQVLILEALQQNSEVVQTAILNKVPLVESLLSYLLFQTKLTIDDAAYGSETVEATARAEILLQNLIIQIANAVMQPLLDRFGDVVEIKQLFYDKRLLSSREIERFRNQLSWKYRVEQWLNEPQAIFESRFNLLIFHEQGITQTSIYAPRNQELAELSGVQYAITLALEARDAIAPRLSAAVSIVGSGLVYVLTEVIGRGLGLIGRGMVKGIGNVLQDGAVRSKERG